MPAPTRLKTPIGSAPRRANPDLNPGHRNAAQQFVDVAAAYDLLSDPRRRAIYDCELKMAVARRREARERLVSVGRQVRASPALRSPSCTSYWLGVAVQMARDDVPVQPADAQAAFVDRRDWSGTERIRERRCRCWLDGPSALPVVTRTRALRWRSSKLTVAISGHGRLTSRPDLPRRPADRRQGGRPCGPGLRARCRSARTAEWKTYRDDRFAYSLSYPAGVFTTEKASPSRSDSGFVVERSGGMARGRGPAAKWRNHRLLPAVDHREPLRDRDVLTTRRPDTWLFYPEPGGRKMFYERVSFACGATQFSAWQMTYRTPSKRFDPIVEEIIASTVTMPIGERALGKLKRVRATPFQPLEITHGHDAQRISATRPKDHRAGATATAATRVADRSSGRMQGGTEILSRSQQDLTDICDLTRSLRRKRAI